MEKPSKKLYPDYYRVIAEPIDMITIKANIDNDKYNNSDELMNDFKVRIYKHLYLLTRADLCILYFGFEVDVQQLPPVQ
jgi:hypothetical protein